MKHAFVDKAYRSYFLDIDTANHKIVFIIELNQIKITCNVLFDEYAQVPKQHKSPTLEIAKQSKNLSDFLYLVGMCYRDKDNKILYSVTRIAVDTSKKRPKTGTKNPLLFLKKSKII